MEIDRIRNQSTIATNTTDSSVIIRNNTIIDVLIN